MAIQNFLVGKGAINRAANREGMAPEILQWDIGHIIDIAWESQDPEAKVKQAELFPEGKPSPEQFVGVLTNYIKDNGYDIGLEGVRRVLGREITMKNHPDEL